MVSRHSHLMRQSRDKTRPQWLAVILIPCVKVETRQADQTTVFTIIMFSRYPHLVCAHNNNNWAASVDSDGLPANDAMGRCEVLYNRRLLWFVPHSIPLTVRYTFPLDRIHQLS